MRLPAAVKPLLPLTVQIWIEPADIAALENQPMRPAEIFTAAGSRIRPKWLGSQRWDRIGLGLINGREVLEELGCDVTADETANVCLPRDSWNCESDGEVENDKTKNLAIVHTHALTSHKHDAK